MIVITKTEIVESFIISVYMLAVSLKEIVSFSVAEI